MKGDIAMQIIADKNTFKLGLHIENIKKYKFFLVLLIFLIFGMLFGAFAARGTNELSDKLIENWFNSFINFRKTSDFTSLFFNLYLSSFIFLILIGLSSFGISGVVVLPILILIKGFGTCLISGILYRDFSLSGIAFADLMLLPFNVTNCFLAVFLSGKGMKLSAEFIKTINDVSAKGILLKPEVLIFLKKLLLCVLCSAVVSLAEAVFTICFIKYFNF